MRPIAIVVLATALLAVELPPEEYRVKGAFLLNFARFVEWPPQTFKAPGDPIAICVLGANPFNGALELAAKDVLADNRPVRVRQIGELQQARACQIVFVSLTERKRARALLDAVKDDSVLTVGESEGFLDGGGVIEFRLEEGKVRMGINVNAAKHAGLHISAKLLSLAQSGKK